MIHSSLNLPSIIIARTQKIPQSFSRWCARGRSLPCPPHLGEEFNLQSLLLSLLLFSALPSFPTLTAGLLDLQKSMFSAKPQSIPAAPTADPSRRYPTAGYPNASLQCLTAECRPSNPLKKTVCKPCIPFYGTT